MEDYAILNIVGFLALILIITGRIRTRRDLQKGDRSLKETREILEKINAILKDSGKKQGGEDD